MATDIYNVKDFGATPNSTTNVDQTTFIKAAIDAALTANSGATVQQGGTVYIPNGYYRISGTLLDPLVGGTTWYNPKLTIRGDMPGLAGASGSRLILTSAPSAPVFQVHGNTSTSDRAVGFQLEQLSLEGGNYAATWLSFKQARFCGLKKLKIINTKGRGIYGEDWIDSACQDVYFDNVSDGTVNPVIPALDLKKSSGDAPCKNLRFEALEFTNHTGYACWLRPDTQYVQFLGCRWLGVANSGYSNVRLDDTFQCSFTGCQFYVAGDDHITGDGNVFGLLVTTSTFRDAYNWGIKLNSAYNIIVNNSFANTSGGQGNGDSSVPRGGNISGASGSNNINKGNQGAAGATL